MSAAFVAIAGAALLAAPTAAVAEPYEDPSTPSVTVPEGGLVTGVAITTPIGYGSVAGHLGAGCGYRVAAMIGDLSSSAPKVAITARRAGGSAKTIVRAATPQSVVSGTWVPLSPGSYTITATQGSSSRSIQAQVGIGLQFPSFFGKGQCAVLIP
ncbi:hypothetical protein QSJ18_15655 [Gordonia sp. ABSL1-1]|uniref:hypothetical protein n=1 Tax=Gordonia sp. ABSL1-1 TaxID=3053923 RepID=UPI0025743AF7|nr:hypothetical protein [Gordonia sp. ABSL1-1]MDL9938187.1 hypothetical protein [Gordonia sp. ABSL1-1]